MLNAGKIRLMTDLAIYEKKHGDSVFRINNYYQSDYMISNLIGSFVRYTLCALVVLVCVVILRTDYFFSRINESGITEIFTRIGCFYAAGLFGYLVVTYFVCAMRYKRAKKGILLYATKLKRLSRKYGAKSGTATSQFANKRQKSAKEIS